MRRFALVICITLIAIAPARAQITDINRILAGSVDDAELLLTRYMKPLGAGYGAAMGTGWTHSARSHALLGFHVSVHVGATMVPSGDQSFSITSGELQALELLNPEIGASPTAAGGRNDSAYRFRVGQGDQSADFTMPGGAGLSVVPAPVIQAGIGLINNTSLVVRLLPSFELGSYGTIGSWGVGIQHGLNQWIPGGSLLPVHFSVQAGYSVLNLASDLEEVRFSDQELSWRTHSYSAALLAGRSLAILSVYGGVGLEHAESRLQMRGTFEFETPQGTTTVENPIDVTFAGENLLRTFIGARLNLALIGVRAEYTLASYPSLNVGLSLSLR